MSERFWESCMQGDLASVQAQLSNQTDQLPNHDEKEPDIDWNMMRSAEMLTPFHVACEHHHLAIVRLLLEDPRIDVNQGDVLGRTAFYRACLYDRGLQVAKILLQHPRIDVEMPSSLSRTPLWAASSAGNVHVAKWILANDRQPPNLWTLGKDFSGNLYRPVEIAEKQGRYRMVHLLALVEGKGGSAKKPRLNSNVVFKIRLEIGWIEPSSAEMFALMVLYCDEYLKIKPEFVDSQAHRFFRLSSLLPIELQMALSFRAMASTKTLVRTTETERAFRKFITETFDL